MEAVERVGPYLLDEVVGQGSSGIVWRAYDEISGDVVAVKLLGGAYDADPMAGARFARECELVGAFAHPGLVRLRARGTVAGTGYLVMDLALGQTIQALRREGAAMDVDEAVRLVARVAEAVGAMHAAGWVHRDLKPANIIIGADERPRVLDFGLTERIELDEGRLTKAGFFVGTPLYVAPEQMMGAPPKASMDVYALGAILFELVSGAPPFVGAAEAVLAAKSTRGAPPAPVAPPLAALIAQTLDRSPENRPADGAELAQRLEALAESSLVSTRDVPPGPEGLTEARTQVVEGDSIEVQVATPVDWVEPPAPDHPDTAARAQRVDAIVALHAPEPPAPLPAPGDGFGLGALLGALAALFGAGFAAAVSGWI